MLQYLVLKNHIKNIMIMLIFLLILTSLAFAGGESVRNEQPTANELSSPTGNAEIVPTPDVRYPDGIYEEDTYEGGDTMGTEEVF